MAMRPDFRLPHAKAPETNYLGAFFSRNGYTAGLHNWSYGEIKAAWLNSFNGILRMSAIVAYILAFFISIPCNPKIWTHYITDPIAPFDAAIYLAIAKTGYVDLPLPAFYPLWPKLLSLFEPYFSYPNFIHVAHFLSLTFFFLSLPLIWKLAARLTNETMATWTIFFYALNPLSVFHAIPYAESLFCLEAAWFLLSTLNFFEAPSLKKALPIFIGALLMSASRTIVTQIIMGGLITAVLMEVLLWGGNETKPFRKSFRIWYGATLTGCILGYLPFGLYCLKTFNNFWQPFTAQTYWNRHLGLHWTVFTDPKSMGGSDNVLTWDLQAFYLPTIVLAWLMIASLRDKRQAVPAPRITTAGAFVTLFCILIAAAHSALAFLTYPIFAALSKHVFSTPFFFIGATTVLHHFLPEPYRYRFLCFYMLGTIIYLLNFWTRIGNIAFIG